jgi:hypothetical protein
LRDQIVGQVELVDCVSEHSSPWFTGPFGFVLRYATPLSFKPCGGATKFFSVA